MLMPAAHGKSITQSAAADHLLWQMRDGGGK
jgi:hypothetical protein